MYVLLSRTQAGPGRIVKQEQEKISRNHVQTFSGLSVLSENDGLHVGSAHAALFPLSCDEVGLGHSLHNATHPSLLHKSILP